MTSGDISLEDQEPTFGNISLTAPDQVAAVPVETAHPRAAKAHFGLGELSPGFNTLFEGISNGQEPQLRQDISRQYDAYLRVQKMSALQDMGKLGADANIDEARALLAYQPNTNPDTVFEKTYAQQLTTTVAQNDPKILEQAQLQSPEGSVKLMDSVQDAITNQESAKKINSETEENYNKQNIGSKALDIVGNLYPFLTASHLRNIVTETQGILPGNNLEEQVIYLWSLPPEQFKSEFQNAVDKLKAVNASDAVIFSNAVLHYSGQEQFGNNLAAVADATIVGGPILRFAKVLKGAIKGNASKTINIGNTLEAVGDIEKAADVKAVEQATAKSQEPITPVVDRGFDPLGQKLDLSSTLPSHTNPSILGINPGSLSRERAARIEGTLIAQNKLIDDTLPGLARVSRLPQNELNVGLARTQERMEEQFNHLQDAVLDFRHLPAEKTPTNIDYVLMNVGKEGSEIKFAEDLGFPLGPPGKTADTEADRFLKQMANKYGAEADLATWTAAERTRYDRLVDRSMSANWKFTLEHEFTEQGRAEKGASYVLRDEEGRDRVRALFNIEGKTATLEDINAIGVGGELSKEAARNVLGPSVIRNMLREFQKANPEVTKIIANRVSGARTGGVYDVMVENEINLNLSSTKKSSEFLTATEANFGEVVLGKTDATLFKSYEEANNTALRDYGLNYKQFQVVQGPGDKWYISIPMAVDETDPAIRNMRLETSNQNNDSAANYYLGYLRSPADQVSPFLRNNRLLATTAPTELHKLIKEIAKPLLDLKQYAKGTQTIGNALLGKTSWSKLQDVLEYYRDFMDYTRENSRGKWPTSFAELEKDWKKVTGKLPNEREQLAFWSTVKLNDLDYVWRNYNLHRDFARQGIEHVSIPLKEGGYSNPILGKVLEDNTKFPWNNPEDAVMAVFKDGEWSFHSKNNKDLDIQEWIKKPSVKIVQIANPDDRPLKGVLDRNPHFVITEDMERSPLPIKLVDYNPGGHVIYPQQWYAKQPVMEQGPKGRWYHYGDQTIMPFYTRAQAERYTPRLDEFRLMLKRGASDTELDAFVEKNLPKDAAFWKQKFSGPNSILSLEHPISIVERNSTTFRTNPKLKELYKDRLGQDVVSYPESSYNLSAGMDKSFLQDRDGPLMSIKGPGINPWSPLYKLETSPVLKPLFAMERGLFNAVKGLYMNDAKTSTVEQFIKQYSGVLKEDKIENIQRNPYYQFYHGELVKQDGMNYAMRQGAENARRNLKDFLRTSSDLNQDINIANEKVAEFLSKPGLITGEVGSDTIANWYASHDWHLIKHPIDFLRSFNTDLKFGFFNLPQAAVQSAGAFHAIAVSPLRGLAGANAAFLHYMQVMAENHLPEKVADGVLKILDRAAISGGWKKGQFSESVATMNRTGFFNVGREVAWRESISDPELFSTKYQNFLDKSYVFFNFGERNNRLVAWHAAFKEFKDANPDKVITDRVVGEIMNRASLLNADMLRESNSAMQKGILGVSTQFQSFRMRIAEQMMGRRLTTYEKAKALGVSSILWGIPVTISAYGIPWAKVPGGVENFYEDVRKYAIDNGLSLDNKYLKVLHEGVVDIATQYLTGTEHSITKRLGPGVDTSIRDMFNGVKDALEIGFGPTGSLLESFGKAVLPFYAGIYTALRGDQEQFAITHDEVIDVAKQISSVNNLYNGIMAWNYQQYISKNKQLVRDDMTKTDAVMNLLLGSTRKDISDTRLQQSLLHDQAQSEDKIGKWALEEFRKMYMALDQQDYAKADKYLANAKTAMRFFGDFSEDKQQKIFNQATSEAGTLADRVNRQFYDPSKMPASKMPDRLRKQFGIEINR